jgi:hypothetical protein
MWIAIFQGTDHPGLQMAVDLSRRPFGLWKMFKTAESTGWEEFFVCSFEAVVPASRRFSPLFITRTGRYTCRVALCFWPSHGTFIYEISAGIG